METVDTSSRLVELRKLMKERLIDIYGWLPSHLPHLQSHRVNC